MARQKNITSKQKKSLNNTINYLKNEFNISDQKLETRTGDGGIIPSPGSKYFKPDNISPMSCLLITEQQNCLRGCCWVAETLNSGYCTICPDSSTKLNIQNINNERTPGCTDLYASNYNPSATENDGSCYYGGFSQSIGDMNNDGNIDVLDIVLILNGILDDNTPSNLVCPEFHCNTNNLTVNPGNDFPILTCLDSPDVIIGCTNRTACNFNPSATQEYQISTCIYPETYFPDVDDSGSPYGQGIFLCDSELLINYTHYSGCQNCIFTDNPELMPPNNCNQGPDVFCIDDPCIGEYDRCGVCNGGNASLDDCGICFGNNENQDVCGVCYGPGEHWECCSGIYTCDPDLLGHETDCLEIDTDEDGICDIYDDCIGNNYDECSVCDGPGAIYDCGCFQIPEGACDCDDNVSDCLGECGGEALIDECGVCNGDGIPPGSCDCDGNEIDECGVCNGENINLDDCGICHFNCENGNTELIDGGCNLWNMACYGCTDEEALNYDINAIEDDGSCVYTEVSYPPIPIYLQPLFLAYTLPYEQSITSALDSLLDSLVTDVDVVNDTTNIKVTDLYEFGQSTLRIRNYYYQDENNQHPVLQEFSNEVNIPLQLGQRGWFTLDCVGEYPNCYSVPGNNGPGCTVENPAPFNPTTGQGCYYPIDELGYIIPTFKPGQGYAITFNSLTNEESFPSELIYTELIDGCTDPDALESSYNSDATVDDGSCIYCDNSNPCEIDGEECINGICECSDEVDCNGDCCVGVCDDDDAYVHSECDEYCVGGNTGYSEPWPLDQCGICGGTCLEGVPGSCSDIDCNGDCFGDSEIDECGICSGGNTDFEPNSDIDECGNCFGVDFNCTDPESECSCAGCTDVNAGNWNPDATIDDNTCIYFTLLLEENFVDWENYDPTPDNDSWYGVFNGQPQGCNSNTDTNNYEDVDESTTYSWCLVKKLGNVGTATTGAENGMSPIDLNNIDESHPCYGMENLYDCYNIFDGDDWNPPNEVMSIEQDEIIKEYLFIETSNNGSPYKPFLLRTPLIDFSQTSGGETMFFYFNAWNSVQNTNKMGDLKIFSTTTPDDFDEDDPNTIELSYQYIDNNLSVVNGDFTETTNPRSNWYLGRVDLTSLGNDSRFIVFYVTSGADYTSDFTLGNVYIGGV